MTEANKLVRIVSVGEPGSTQEQISTAITSQPDFQLVDMMTDNENLSREIRAAEPDVILIEYQAGEHSTLDVIDELTLQFPEIAIVSILPSNDPLLAQQVMLAGARGFVVQPFTQVNLLSTLRRVSELEHHRRLSQTSLSKSTATGNQALQTFTVFSPRGGTGNSTVALNLAIALHEESGQRVLLLEGKLLFGHLGMMLNIRTPNSVVDLIPHLASLDKALISDVTAKHASGIDVLLSPVDVQAGQGVRPEDLFKILKSLQKHYDFIVIDAGSRLNDNTVTLMDAADRILLITNPDLAALHDVSRFIQISRSLSYPPNKLLILLNRADIRGGVKSRDIERALRHELFAHIPDDGPKALRSLNRGIPILLKYPRSPVSRAVQKVAKALIKLQSGEVAGAPSESIQLQAKLLPKIAPVETS